MAYTASICILTAISFERYKLHTSISFPVYVDKFFTILHFSCLYRHKRLLICRSPSHSRNFDRCSVFHAGLIEDQQFGPKRDLHPGCVWKQVDGFPLTNFFFVAQIRGNHLSDEKQTADDSLPAARGGHRHLGVGGGQRVSLSLHLRHSPGEKDS